MPRPPRYFLPDFPQHIIARGVDRQAVFFRAEDYRLYLTVLRQAANTHGCAVHAYVLMTNHVHLLMTPKTQRAIPLVFQALGRSYVQAVNRRYQRTGTLWEGRYRSSLIDSDAYLLTCYRYIELNPVRAGLARLPHLYPYSSHRYNAHGKDDPVVTPHEIYRALGADSKARRVAYEKLFADPIDSSQLRKIRDCANASQVLGNDKFKDRIQAIVGHSVRPGKPGRPSKIYASDRSPNGR